MVWYPYYSIGARDVNGNAVQTASGGKFYALNDQAGAGTALVTRALVQSALTADGLGSGTGGVLNTIAITDYTTPQFECQSEWGWFKSGTAPAVLLFSPAGMRAAAVAAQAAAETAAAGITTGLNARLRNRGLWVASTAYVVNDVFWTAAGLTFLVLQNHTSGSTAPTANATEYMIMGGGSGGSVVGAAFKSQLLKPVYRTGVNRDGPWPARDNDWYQNWFIGPDPNPTDLAAWDLRGRY